MNRFGAALQANWDWRAAGNFIFGGAGSGLLVATSIASPSTATSGVTALALIGAGLALVWLEIGRPWRGLNVLMHPQTSWMTREAMAALVTFGLGAAGLALEDPRIMAGAGGAAFGFLYCQGRIIQAAKGIPAWREPAIVPLVVATGLAEGASLYLVLAALSGTSAAWAAHTLIGLLVLRAAAWHRYRMKFAAAGISKGASDALRTIGTRFLGVGNLVPAALLLTDLAMPSAIAFSAALAGIVAIWGGWELKFHLITRLAHVQGYAVGKLRHGHPNTQAR